MSVIQYFISYDVTYIYIAYIYVYKILVINE